MSPSPGWVRGDPFFDRLERLLHRCDPVIIHRPQWRRAAVLLAMWNEESRPRILFIRRSHRVRHHKGEISFPGGVWESRDGDLLQTALREAHEEVGILPAEAVPLGRLDDAMTLTSRYVVAPFVAALPSPPALRANREVAEILPVPLHRFLTPDRFEARQQEIDGLALPVYAYEVEGLRIWGATARILQDLMSRIRKDPTTLKALIG